MRHASPSDHEVLLEFLYQCPFALLQLNGRGDVELMSAAGARLLMQIAPEARLDNLFVVLDGVAPWLRGRLAAFTAETGTVCDAERVDAGQPAGAPAPLVLELTLQRLGPDRLMAVLVDASRLAAAERASEERQRRLEEASRAKGDFLAAMSHEIRTPMNGVLGMIGLLLDTPLSPEQRAYAETVANSAEALLTIINDVLDFSKIEARKLTLCPAPMDLRRALEDAASLLRPAAAEKGIGLAVSYAPEAPRHVVADPDRVRQVLLNLAGNAVKFTERGHVALSVRCLERAPGRATLRIQVDDTGIGIPQDRMGRLFQEFSQVDATTTRRFGGTGLGLAISRRLVELMGGAVGVESQLGVGSRFWVDLPLPLGEAAAAPAERAAAPAPPPAAGCRRVLVVDDNPVNRQVAARILEKLGCRVDLSSNGREAVALAARGGYDVIFMDCQMPELDGYAAAAEIRRGEGTARPTPIIALTASVMQGERERCLAAGMSDYLRKPFKPAELDEVLRRWAPAGRYTSSGSS